MPLNMTTALEPTKRSRGRPKLSEDTRRVRLACLVAPETLRQLEEIAANAGTNVGRLLDQLAANPE